VVLGLQGAPNDTGFQRTKQDFVGGIFAFRFADSCRMSGLSPRANDFGRARISGAAGQD
jgi:hypothetical protein